MGATLNPEVIKMEARVARVVVSLALALCGLLPLACGDGGGGNKKAAGTSAVVPAARPEPRAPFVPLDACSLLTKPEVEALVGRPTMEPAKEQMANLVTCAFGDPEAPRIGGRPAAQVLTLAVFTGEEGAYYAGPVAQARDSYETARKSAASSEAVAGLGESAYWDSTFKTLSAHKGKYWITAEVGAGLETAKKVMGKAIERLP
jgi:hypothetical protein